MTLPDWLLALLVACLAWDAFLSRRHPGAAKTRQYWGEPNIVAERPWSEIDPDLDECLYLPSIVGDQL